MTETRRVRDVIDPARAAALHVTLGQEGKLTAGDPLPPFYHQAFFWEPEPQENLGPDGHPKLGAFIPDLGFPRRMWAGGTLQFHQPLICGTPAERRSTLERAEEKTGRAGPMALVTVRHEIRQGGTLILDEVQELVYLPADFKRPPPRTAEGTAQATQELSFSTTTLFRYSALTFNGHRIHYDEAYSRGEEGYDGLVVHGPLLAQHLMLMATAQLGPIARFSFRATAPLMHHETARLCRDGNTLWVEGPDQQLCMTATAEARV